VLAVGAADSNIYLYNSATAAAATIAATAGAAVGGANAAPAAAAAFPRRAMCQGERTAMGGGGAAVTSVDFSFDSRVLRW
jgi:hypothetical protein